MEGKSLDASYAATPHSIKASPIAVVFAAIFQDKTPVSFAAQLVHWCDAAERFSEFGSIRTTSVFPQAGHGFDGAEVRGMWIGVSHWLRNGAGARVGGEF
jgi:hypothetical protein